MSLNKNIIVNLINDQNDEKIAEILYKIIDNQCIITNDDLYLLDYLTSLNEEKWSNILDDLPLTTYIRMKELKLKNKNKLENYFINNNFISLESFDKIYESLNNHYTGFVVQKIIIDLIEKNKYQQEIIEEIKKENECLKDDVFDLYFENEEFKKDLNTQSSTIHELISELDNNNSDVKTFENQNIELLPKLISNVLINKNISKKNNQLNIKIKKLQTKYNNDVVKLKKQISAIKKNYEFLNIHINEFNFKIELKDKVIDMLNNKCSIQNKNLIQIENDFNKALKITNKYLDRYMLQKTCLSKNYEKYMELYNKNMEQYKTNEKIYCDKINELECENKKLKDEIKLINEYVIDIN